MLAHKHSLPIVYDPLFTSSSPHSPQNFASPNKKLRKLRKMSRDEATKHKNEGNAAFKKKQWNDAIAAYTKAAETDPSWEVPYSNRSQVYVDFHFFFILSDRSFLRILSLFLSSSNTQDVIFTQPHTKTNNHTHKQTHTQALLDETVR